MNAERCDRPDPASGTRGECGRAVRGKCEPADAADRRLDMELEQTFPASDPIPWIHDVGRVQRK